MRRSVRTGEALLDSDERRLSALEAVCDPLTTTLLSRVGMEQDWHCLEIGAGRGSIARWLAARCPYGSVTAIDTDVRHIAGLPIPNLRVYRHDVVDGPGMPEGSFDLAHARALLVHLPDRQAVLRRVITWLAPGGWLVVEEPVLFPTDECRDSSLHRALVGFERLMAERLGSDFRWPRHLPAALSTAGFAEMRTTTYPIVASAAGEINEFWRINLTELGPDLIESDLVDQRTLTRALATLDDPDHCNVIMAFVCVSCRRPSNKDLTCSVRQRNQEEMRNGRLDYNHLR
jgi:SAM-dependent methyltransferase